MNTQFAIGQSALYEVARKIFNEVLEHEDLIFWARTHRQEKFPIELRDIYMAECLWEEEFYITFSLVYLEAFLWRNCMDETAEKIREVLGKMPRRVEAVRNIMTGMERSPVPKKKTQSDCYQRVHERVRKFVFGDQDILSFDNK